MNHLNLRRTFLLLAGAGIVGAALPASVLAQAAAPGGAARNRALFEVTDNDPARWNMILYDIRNLRKGLGAEASRSS